MTREEAINHGKEQLEIFGGEHREFIELAIKALEQQSCEDKQDCEHCIHTYGTLGCCDMVNNEWIYDCDFGREQYRKEYGKPCEDCISREYLIDKIGDVDGLEGHDNSNLFAKHYMNLVKNAPSVQPQQGWIPVSERLPEEYNHVLCQFCMGGMAECYYAHNFFHVVGGLRINSDEVIAWMSLPQLYEESEDDGNAE